jgi:hypothetical protein
MSVINLASAIESATSFDFGAQAIALKSFLALKDSNKDARADLKRREGVAELILLMPAILYGANTFDLQPLANVIARGKLSAVAKRAVKGIFPSHTFALIGDTKRPGFVATEGKAKVADKEKLAVLFDAYTSGDSIHCEQIKKVFPAPDTSKAQAMEKLSKALAARMKSDGLTKEDLANILKGL